MTPTHTGASIVPACSPWFAIADPHAVRFASSPVPAIERLWSVLSPVPQSLIRIAARVDMDCMRVCRLLEAMMRDGLALRLDGSLYAAAGKRPAIVDLDQTSTAVGCRILLHLTQPRRPKDIAAHIRRRQSCTTGHLRHLRKRGLVTRLHDGTYCLPFEFPLSELTVAGRARQSAARTMLDRLDGRGRINDITDLMGGLDPEIARPVLDGLVLAGAVRRNPWDGYSRTVIYPEPFPESAATARHNSDPRNREPQPEAM